MTARVSSTERIRADIDQLFASEGDLRETLEQVARLEARLLLQSALEAEVTPPATAPYWVPSRIRTPEAQSRAGSHPGR